MTTRCFNAKDGKYSQSNAKSFPSRAFAITFATFAFKKLLLAPAIDQLSSLYDAALALIYPQACAVCGGSVESRHDGVACASCWQTTRIFKEHDTLCARCGAFTEAAIDEDRRKTIRCGRCDDDAFDGARRVDFMKEPCGLRFSS